MRKLLFFLLLIPSLAFSQSQTVYSVNDLTSLSSYYGYATRLFVVSENADYVICTSCTVDGTTILSGAGGRKWKRMSDTYHLPYNGDTTYYLAGDSTLHKLQDISTTIIDTTTQIIDTTNQNAGRVIFTNNNNHFTSDNKFKYKNSGNKLVINNTSVNYGSDSVNLAVDGNILADTVFVETPPEDDSSHKVATTEWVKQLGLSGGGGTYTAGRGLTLTGSAFGLDTAKRYTFTQGINSIMYDSTAGFYPPLSMQKYGLRPASGVISAAEFINKTQRSNATSSYNVAGYFFSDSAQVNVGVWVPKGITVLGYSNLNSAYGDGNLLVYNGDAAHAAASFIGATSTANNNAPIANFSRNNSSYPAYIRIANDASLIGMTGIAMNALESIECNGRDIYFRNSIYNNLNAIGSSYENVLYATGFYGRIGFNTASQPTGILEVKNNGRCVGTVAVTSGSPTVTGTSTAFLKDVKVGDNITIADVGGPYTVSTIASNTSLTLTSNASSSASDKAYTNSTTTSTDAFVVNSNNNVGIGNATPAYTLDVTGSIHSTGIHLFDATNTATGTTGDQTINKPSGTVNIAAAGSSVTVTNSLVTANSIVYAVIRTHDANSISINSVVPAAGSFTIYLNGTPAAEISIGFTVFNN